MEEGRTMILMYEAPGLGAFYIISAPFGEWVFSSLKKQFLKCHSILGNIAFTSKRGSRLC